VPPLTKKQRNNPNSDNPRKKLQRERCLSKRTAADHHHEKKSKNAETGKSKLPHVVASTSTSSKASTASVLGDTQPNKIIHNRNDHLQHGGGNIQIHGEEYPIPPQFSSPKVLLHRPVYPPRTEIHPTNSQLQQNCSFNSAVPHYRNGNSKIENFHELQRHHCHPNK
jgi:hypothetical protein